MVHLLTYHLNSRNPHLFAVPSPPRLLLDRVKLLEDHLVRLEKEYPPWAALHFNQPLRGVSYSPRFFCATASYNGLVASPAPSYTHHCTVAPDSCVRAVPCQHAYINSSQLRRASGGK